MRNITLGADPEVFMYAQGTHKPVSSIGKIGGSKLEPLFIDDKGHAVQEDNVAIEWNIPAVKTPEEFMYHNRFMLDYVKTRAKEHGCYIAYKSFDFFDDDQLIDMKARTFGCEPDINVWEMREQRPPSLPAGLQNLRTAGGHIHIGWDDPTFEEQIEMAKAMDVFAGVAGAMMDGDGNLRRQLYGKAGSFRLKDYGIEYRTLSNYWLLSDFWMLEVAKKTLTAADYVLSGKRVDPADSDDIQAAINKVDRVALARLRHKYSLEIL